MAAAHLFHVVSNHPFIDGNKRTGAGAAFVFLRMNDLKVTAPEDEFTEMTLNVARGEATKQDVTEFFRRHTRP
jgi:death-on-curing protein